MGAYQREYMISRLSVLAYDPVLERFLQPDPSQQEGIFTYVYSGDDPVDYNDKSGMDPAPSGVDPTQAACGEDPTSGACMAAFAAFQDWNYAAQNAESHITDAVQQPSGGGGPIITFPGVAGAAGGTIDAATGAAVGIIPGIGVPLGTAIGAGTGVAVPAALDTWLQAQNASSGFALTGQYTLTTSSAVNQSAQGIAAQAAVDAAQTADKGRQLEGQAAQALLQAYGPNAVVNARGKPGHALE